MHKSILILSSHSFLLHEQELREQGIVGKYMLHNFGTVDESTNPNEDAFMLNFLYEELLNTIVTIRIDATNIVFVYNV